MEARDLRVDDAVGAGAGGSNRAARDVDLAQVGTTHSPQVRPIQASQLPGVLQPAPFPLRPNDGKLTLLVLISATRGSDSGR